MNNKHILTWAATILFFGGCAVGPKFKAPVVETPPEYLGSVNDSTEELLWWKIFNDTTLSRLIDRAVQNNRNVGMALSRVEQARLNLKATPEPILAIVAVFTASTVRQRNLHRNKERQAGAILYFPSDAHLGIGPIRQSPPDG